MNEPRRATHRMLLLALARFADGEGICWPSVTTLAARCAAGRREVQRRLDWLEAHGFIERDQRPGRSTMYRLTFELSADGAGGADKGNSDEARGGATPTGDPTPISQGAALRPPQSGTRPTLGAALRSPKASRKHHLTVSSRHAHARGGTVTLAEALPAAVLDKEMGTDEEFVEALVRRGVDEPAARRLVAGSAKKHVRAMLERGRREAKGPGWYIRAIEDGYDHARTSSQKLMTHTEALAILERKGIALSPANPFTNYFDVVQVEDSTFFAPKQRPDSPEPGNP